MSAEEHSDPEAASRLKEGGTAVTRAMNPAEDAGTIIGRYHLLQKIGEGGMGEVWLAEQKEPVRRRVALKLVKAGMNSREVVARFESERQALALMDHPAIAKVLDAGATPEGAPYFVMEYVVGFRSQPTATTTGSARATAWICSCASVRASSTRIRKPSSTAT